MSTVKPLPPRGRLLEVAAHIVATEGASALTVRRLSRELETSTIALYRRFAGKEALIEATAGEFMVRYAAALRAVAITADPLFDLACLANTYRSISLAHRDLYKVAFASGRLSVADDAPRGIRDMFDYSAAAISRCLADKSLGGPNAGSGVIVIWSALHGHVSLEMERVFPSGRDAERAWRRCLNTLLIGLGADAARVTRILRRTGGSRARRRAETLPEVIA